MTRTDLERRAATLARELRPWVAKATERIEAKTSDALAHARVAVTDTLKRTPDGRATVRKAGLSPSYSGALSRLDELLEWLAGPSVNSLDGLVRDARSASYRASFAAWKPFIPGELWVASDPQPTSAGVRDARRAVLHGMDVRTELSGPFDAAKRSLKAAIASAGMRAVSGWDSDLILRTWHLKVSRSIVLAATRALSDGQVDADVRAGRDLVHPDYLEPIPLGK